MTGRDLTSVHTEKGCKSKGIEKGRTHIHSVNPPGMQVYKHFVNKAGINVLSVALGQFGFVEGMLEREG
jgi:hypothetical protein